MTTSQQLWAGLGTATILLTQAALALLTAGGGGAALPLVVAALIVVALTGMAVSRSVAGPDRARAAAALRASEERRRLALDAADLGAWNIDGATFTLTADERFRHIFHGSAAPITFEEAFAAIHPADRERVRTSVAAAMRPADPAPYLEEYRVVHPDGTTRWVLGTGRATVVRGDGGPRVASFDGTVADITPRVTAARERDRLHALADADRRLLDAVFEALPVALVVADATGRLVRMNRATYALWGDVPPTGSIDEYAPWVGYWPDTGRRVAPAEWPLARVLTSGEAVAGDAFEIEPFGGGGRRHAVISGAPVRDAAGRVVAGVVAQVDVTERRQTAERFRALVAASADVMYRMSADFAELQPLDGRGFVASTAAPVRDWLTRNIPAAEHARVRAAVAAAVAAKTPFDLEHQVVRFDGSVGWTHSRAVPILDAAGEVIEWFGTARDVTRRKAAEAALARVTAESDQRMRLYETILSNTPDLAYVWDLDHRFTYANEGLLAMWGRTWDEAIGKTCLDLGYEPWHAAMHDREIETVKATKRPVRGEVPFTGTFGRRVYDYILVPVIGTDGAVEAVAGTTRDVTDRKAAEERLAESEERLRTLFETMTEGYCVVELLPDADRPDDYRFLFANPAYERHTGMRAVVGKTVRELIPGFESRFVAGYGRVAATGEPWRFVDHVAGLGRWFEVSAVRVGGPGSRQVAVLFSDVSARQRAEDALRASERQLAAVFQHAPAFMGVLRGPDHVFERANAQYDRLVGGRPLVGLAVRDALPEVVAQGFIELLDRVYRTGEPFVGTGTLVRLEPGGGRPAEDRYVDFIYQPMRDADGAVGGILVQGVDVTARERAEATLRASEERYRTLVEQVTEHAIFGSDLRGRATTWNEGVRRVLGFEEVEFVGRDIRAAIFTPEDVRAGVPQKELDDAAAHGSASDDRWMVRKDGTRFWAAGITTARRDEAGALVGFTKVMRDMTAQKQMETELRRLAADLSEADRRKDEFLATLAHELRNPLAPIRNGLQLLKLAAGDPAALEQARGMMERQLGHMVRLIDDLMDVSRISRGKVELRPEPVELAAVVRLAVETSRPLIEAGGHALTVDVPAEPIVVTADAARLAQVVANVLNNAAKYSEPGGRITLRATREGDEAVVCVADTGVGIPAAMLPRVFDLFTQADQSLEKAQGGLGIGLSLVKGLVEMHGGRVTAASDGPGRGSTFTIRLPAGGTGALSAVPTAPEPAAAPARRRVLVADDNRDAAASLATLLTALGHEARTAHDGLAAVEAGEAFRPDVVLLDIGMPKLNGYDACRRIRERPWGRTAVLVACTGWGQEDDRRRSADAGFDHHLVKPVDPAGLLALLAEPAAG